MNRRPRNPLPALNGRYKCDGVIDLFAADEIPRPTTKPATVGPAVPPPWPDDKSAEDRAAILPASADDSRPPEPLIVLSRGWA